MTAGTAPSKVTTAHLSRPALLYLLPELQRISAAQQAGRSSRRIIVLSGMPDSAGGVSCDRSVGAAESGHTALNRSLPLPRRCFSGASHDMPLSLPRFP